MTYIRGNKAEFDAWEALGAEGWNWDTLYPYFKKAERFSPPTEAQIVAGASYDVEHHGYSGNVHVGYQSAMMNGSFHSAVQTTWEELGYPRNVDPNGGDVSGFSVWPQTLDRDANLRYDASRAYYIPVEHRPNLFIVKGAARKILWSAGAAGCGLTAEGVEFTDSHNQTTTLGASREVVLSAGALATPLILESSGVGNPQCVRPSELPKQS
jgi:choline dehydrogenase